MTRSPGSRVSVSSSETGSCPAPVEPGTGPAGSAARSDCGAYPEGSTAARVSARITTVDTVSIRTARGIARRASGSRMAMSRPSSSERRAMAIVAAAAHSIGCEWAMFSKCFA